MKDGKKTYLGSFDDEEGAARKYDDIAATLGRPLNFPAPASITSRDDGGGKESKGKSPRRTKKRRTAVSSRKQKGDSTTECKNENAIEIEWNGEWFRGSLDRVVPAGQAVVFEDGSRDVIPTDEVTERIRMHCNGNNAGVDDAASTYSDVDDPNRAKKRPKQGDSSYQHVFPVGVGEAIQSPQTAEDEQTTKECAPLEKKVKIEQWDGSMACLMCTNTIRVPSGEPDALTCAVCTSVVYHRGCAGDWAETCPTCNGSTVVKWTRPEPPGPSVDVVAVNDHDDFEAPELV